MGAKCDRRVVRELECLAKDHRRQHADGEPEPVEVHVNDLLRAHPEIVFHSDVDGRLGAAIPFADKREVAVLVAEELVGVVGESLEAEERAHQLVRKVVAGQGSGAR